MMKINKMEAWPWLEEPIYEYIKNNPEKDSVDVVSHFKLRADITLNSLGKLVDQGKVIRKHLSGATYGYVCVGDSDRNTTAGKYHEENLKSNQSLF